MFEKHFYFLRGIQANISSIPQLASLIWDGNTNNFNIKDKEETNNYNILIEL